MLGTENPTQIDINFFPHLYRLSLLKDSAYHELLWAPSNIENYPHINAFLEAIVARPEFQGDVLATKRIYHEFVRRARAHTADTKFQLYLPYPSEVDNTTETIYILEATTPKPTVNTKVPRLYGHLLCPFVEMARMALAARNVEYQRCEVDLGKKTPWHLAINGGLVPILELQDGTLINESKILVDFAEDAYPESGYSILPEDPVVRAKMRLAFPLIDGFNQAYYPIYLNLKKGPATEDQYAKLREKL